MQNMVVPWYQKCQDIKVPGECWRIGVWATKNSKKQTCWDGHAAIYKLISKVGPYKQSAAVEPRGKFKSYKKKIGGDMETIKSKVKTNLRHSQSWLNILDETWKSSIKTEDEVVKSFEIKIKMEKDNAKPNIGTEVAGQRLVIGPRIITHMHAPL